MGGERHGPKSIEKLRLLERLRAKADTASSPAVDELTVACVGARHANPKRKSRPTGSREMEIMFTERGRAVDLRPEPENKHDRNAIAVYARTGIQLGYVSADRTPLIHRAWHDARDVHAGFQERTSWGAWIRIAFGREPMLPPESERRPTSLMSPDWWPDEEPGDEGMDWPPPED